MSFITDLFSLILVLLVLIAFPLAVLAVLGLIIGAFIYLIAGPEFRMKMVGWAPGVEHGVKKTLGLAQALQDRSLGHAE